MDDELRAKEFRNDPTGGCDLAVRTQKQLARQHARRGGVSEHAAVASAAVREVDLNLAVARAYNDWVHEVGSAPKCEHYIAGCVRAAVDDVALGGQRSGTLHCDVALGFRRRNYLVHPVVVGPRHRQVQVHFSDGCR